MKLEAKTRLRAGAMSDWQDSIRATYGEGVRFKKLGNLARAFVGENQIAEFNDGKATIQDDEGHLLEMSSDPGLPPDEGDLLSEGVAFETLIDGDPRTTTPLVQDVTRDDGGVTPPDEQPLLMDDISLPSSRK